MRLDHVGWITNDQKLFERFWCDGLGFEKVWESTVDAEKTFALFRWYGGMSAVRYKKDDMVIEIHVFDTPLFNTSNEFRQFGINHIGLWVEDREKFIEDLESKLGHVDIRRYWDTRGWWNIFIRDYDGNWIQLMTTFKEAGK